MIQPTQKMSLIQHFMELRKRLIWVLGFFVAAFGIGLYIAPQLQSFMTAPLLNAWGATPGRMIYTNLTDGLFVQFALATLFAIFISLPFLLFQAWAYAAPGLRDRERRFIGPILILSPALFMLGAAFAYYILFPMVFAFFIKLNAAAPVPTAFFPSTTNYLAFIIDLLRTFGLAFQLPLVMVILNRIGILSRKSAFRAWRYVVVGAFIFSAFFVPPDVLSQTMLAVPLIGLYFSGILFMKGTGTRNRNKES